MKRRIHKMGDLRVSHLTPPDPSPSPGGEVSEKESDDRCLGCEAGELCCCYECGYCDCTDYNCSFCRDETCQVE